MFDGDIEARRNIFRKSVLLRSKTVIIALSALAAPKPEVGSHKGIGHTSGGNRICLHLEDDKNESQYKSRRYPVKCCTNRLESGMRRLLLLFFFTEQPQTFLSKLSLLIIASKARSVKSILVFVV